MLSVRGVVCAVAVCLVLLLFALNPSLLQTGASHGKAVREDASKEEAGDGEWVERGVAVDVVTEDGQEVSGTFERISDGDNADTAVVVKEVKTESGEDAVVKMADGEITDANWKTHRAYLDALVTLKCFNTEGCYPVNKCVTGKVGDLSKLEWEHKPFCIDDVRAAKQKHGGKCLVYSVGINNNWEWETDVATALGCEVHAFDPTMKQTDGMELAPGVTFHKLGLQSTMKKYNGKNSAQYSPIDSKLLLSLPEMMAKLGHTGRTVDFLMLDCEGCEWGVLDALTCDGDAQSVSVGQMTVEFHYAINLQMEFYSDVMQAAAATKCMAQDRWVQTARKISGTGPTDWTYVPGVVSSHPDSRGFLMVANFRRLPDDVLFWWEKSEKSQLLSRDREMTINAMRKEGKTEAEITAKESQMKVAELQSIHDWQQPTR